MRRYYVLFLSCFGCILLTGNVYTQLTNYEFGKGFNLLGKDSTFSLRAAFRFQTLLSNSWTVNNDDLSDIGHHESAMLIRRSRLKFDGFAYTPKLKYKFELGLSNRDIDNKLNDLQGTSSNIILDAYLEWNFYKGFSLKVGQGKLPGNRERVISSGNMQFVDRSLLNSRFNLDRDIGFQLIYSSFKKDQFSYKMILAISQGEGRNVIANNIGGYEYTGRLEVLPFGTFASKGDYIGSAIKSEKKPKLSLGFTFDYNSHCPKTRGNLGSSLLGYNTTYKSLLTGFADLMFKYKGFSLMGEYAIRATKDRSPILYDADNNQLGVYYTGAALNLQAGYLFKKKYEFAVRYTKVQPQNMMVSTNENQYLLGFSRYIQGHKLKIQTDIGYAQVETKNDQLFWRMQVDIHF